MCIYIYIYIYIERERERAPSDSCRHGNGKHASEPVNITPFTIIKTLKLNQINEN
jgi:hypothetical protein